MYRSFLFSHILVPFCLMSPSRCLSILADDNFNPTRPPCTLRQFPYSFNFDSKLFTLRRILHLFWAPNPNNNLKENQLNWWKRIERYHCDIHEIALRLLFSLLNWNSNCAFLWKADNRRTSRWWPAEASQRISKDFNPQEKPHSEWIIWLKASYETLEVIR